MPSIFAEIDRARAQAQVRYEHEQSGKPPATVVRPHPVVVWLTRLLFLAIPFAIILSLVGGEGARSFLSGARPFIFLGATLQVIRWGSALHLLRPGLFGAVDPTPRTLAVSSGIWLLGLIAIFGGHPELLVVFWIGLGLTMARLVHRSTLQVMARRETARLHRGKAPADRLSE